MRRNLTTLKAKSGHSQNHAWRTLIELAIYREKIANTVSFGAAEHFDTQYSGFTNAARPADSPLYLRPINTHGRG